MRTCVTCQTPKLRDAAFWLDPANDTQCKGCTLGHRNRIPPKLVDGAKSLTCTRCKKSKPYTLEFFYANRRACKVCCRAASNRSRRSQSNGSAQMVAAQYADQCVGPTREEIAEFDAKAERVIEDAYAQMRAHREAAQA